MSDGFDEKRLQRLRDVLATDVARGKTPGLAWLVARGGEVHAGVAGTMSRGGAAPIERDTQFRIASMTKPMAAVAALMLVEACELRLDDPVDGLLPELADRRVLVDPSGPVDGPTVAADRAITVGDVLTFRLGFGMDFEQPWPQPFLEAMDGLGMGGGAPSPASQPDPDEWMRLLGTLPLMRQPGERWLYNTGFDVLGVLIARAAGQPLDVVLRERIFEPLGMSDTAFFASDPTRLVTGYSSGEVVGTGDEWTTPPRFPSAAGGLVSTIDDVHAFTRVLLDGGRPLLSRVTVDAMTTDHLLPSQGGPSPDGASGWGYGVGVARRRDGIGRGAGSYGWDGGLGTSWCNDPAEGLIGIVLTNEAFTGATLAPAVVRDFWTATYAALR